MNIYVGNLSYEVTEDELKQMFEEYGSIVKAIIIKDRETGRSKGFGFVEMNEQEDGKKAIQELDGTPVKDRNIKVNEARPRKERPKRKSW
ncbi:MAG: RNA-binding protein [Candidatus Marinimicrobia bacterium]|jgi:RNA recognition motif-containing protein|nr:RNA-binding protein [Candidatus Neomarinimicrobiota bacterium]